MSSYVSLKIVHHDQKISNIQFTELKITVRLQRTFQVDTVRCMKAVLYGNCPCRLTASLSSKVGQYVYLNWTFLVCECLLNSFFSRLHGIPGEL